MGFFPKFGGRLIPEPPQSLKIKYDTFSQKNNVKKELVRVSIRVDDKNFDYSYLKKEKGYEFLSVEKYENNENPNFKRWLIIVSYFRDVK